MTKTKHVFMHDDPIIHRLIEHTSENVTAYKTGQNGEPDEKHTSIQHTFITCEHGLEDPEADPVIIEMDTSNIKSTDDLKVQSSGFNTNTNQFDFNVEPAVPVSGTIHWQDKEYPILTYKTKNKFDQIAGEPNVTLKIITAEPY